MLGAVANDVDHVIDGDAAKQDVVFIHHRRRHPVVVGELRGDDIVGGVHRDGGLFVVDQFVDRRGWIVGQQRIGRHATQVLVPAADHEQVVGVVRHFTAQAQVAQHHVHGHVGAHRDDIGIHQPAGAVFRVGQGLFEALAILAVHRLQHFVDDRVGQVLDQVREVVDVEVFDGCDDFVGVHLGQQAVAHVFADMHQHFAVVLGIYQAPHDIALARWQRLEQVADFGRRQGVDHAPHGTQPPGVQRIGQEPKLARGLVLADGLGHGLLREGHAHYRRAGIICPAPCRSGLGRDASQNPVFLRTQLRTAPPVRPSPRPRRRLRCGHAPCCRGPRPAASRP